MLIIVLLAFGLSTGVPQTPESGFAPVQGRAAPLLRAREREGMHISWRWSATPDSVTVVAHYEKATGRKARTRPAGERQIEWDSDHKLGVYPASSHDAFPHCDTKPTRGEQAVILQSRPPRAESPGGGNGCGRRRLRRSRRQETSVAFFT